MTKKRKFTLLFTLLITVAALAQSTRVEVPTEFYRNVLNGSASNGLPEGVEGTPYLNENFSEGLVFIKDSQPYKAELRYNAYNDAIEIKDEKTTTLLKRDYVRAQIANNLFVIHSFKNAKNEMKQGYFIELNKGEIKLLARYEKKFIEGREAQSTYKKATKAKLVDQKEYYILNGKNASQIKIKNSTLKKAFPDEDVEKIVKEKKLNLKEERDVIELLNLINNNKR